MPFDGLRVYIQYVALRAAARPIVTCPMLATSLSAAQRGRAVTSGRTANVQDTGSATGLKHTLSSHA